MLADQPAESIQMELHLMGLDLFLVAFGSFVTTSAIAYAWWSSVRVTFLREELFTERDRLWDKALELKAFDDPAYKQARMHLNALIGTAGLFSARTIRQIGRLGALATAIRLKSESPDLQHAIDFAYKRSINHIVRYMYFYSASGWLRILPELMKSGKQKAQQSTAQFVSSRLPEDLLEADRAAHAVAA